MQGLYDDSDRLRARQAEADVAATADPGASGQGAAAVVAKVITASGPAAPGFFKVEVCDLTGAETEGGTGTLTPLGIYLIAMNVGGSVPAAGTFVLASHVNYRWTFRYS